MSPLWKYFEHYHSKNNGRKPRSEPYYTWPIQMVYYCSTSGVAIDIISIIPSFTSRNFTYLRILRMSKIFNIFKFLHYGKIQIYIAETIHSSINVISFLAFFLLITIVLCGSIVHIFERGEFTVNSIHPNGAYIRHGLNGAPEQSPFANIFACFYWAIITIATVLFFLSCRH